MWYAISGPLKQFLVTCFWLRCSVDCFLDVKFSRSWVGSSSPEDWHDFSLLWATNTAAIFTFLPTGGNFDRQGESSTDDWLLSFICTSAVAIEGCCSDSAFLTFFYLAAATIATMLPLLGPLLSFWADRESSVDNITPKFLGLAEPVHEQLSPTMTFPVSMWLLIWQLTIYSLAPAL